MVALVAVPIPIVVVGGAGFAKAGFVAAGVVALGVFGLQVWIRIQDVGASTDAEKSAKLEPLRAAVLEHRRALVEAVAFRVASVVLGLIPIAAIPLVAKLAVSSSGLALAGVGAVAVAAIVFAGVLHYQSTMRVETAAQTVIHTLRMRIYGHVQQVTMPYFDEVEQGDLLARLSDDLSNVDRLFAACRKILHIVVSIAGVSLALIAMAPEVAWLVLMSLPALVAIADRIQKSYFPLYREWMDDGGRLNATLSSSLEGMATVRSLGAEPAIFDRVRGESEAYRKKGIEVAKVATELAPLIEALASGAILAAVAVGGFLAGGGMTLAAHAGVIVLTQQLLAPLRDVGPIAIDLNRGFAGYARAAEPLRVGVELERAERTLRSVRGDIGFEGVTFGYPNRRRVLEGIDLRLDAGRVTALVGVNGSGKTTLAKLLMRFYEPHGGRVTLDGCDVRSLSLRELRGAVAVVSQDVFLFDGSIGDNLRLAAPEATADELRAAATEAGAHTFIEALPGGYDTRVGERGVQLSGGQRQRIAIARALLRHAPVIVLDEPTSHVDPRAEAELVGSIQRVLAGRTVMLIAHRLATVCEADTICVLKEGRVSERGGHHELLARGGDYAAMWRIQAAPA